jgi:putative transposase
MPRIPRGQAAGYVYHIINRGNGRSEIFHKSQDYQAFLDLLSAAKKRESVKVLAFCLMPNHFHLVLEPEHTTALSKFMQWLLTSHVRRYHRHYRSSGHIWQGRFKSFPIQQDEHLLTVLRYVLQNPVRAGLARSACNWTWSSITQKAINDPLPLEVPPDWLEGIEKPLRDSEIEALRNCVNRQRPFGILEWQESIAKTFGLEWSMRPRGRPKTK